MSGRDSLLALGGALFGATAVLAISSAASKDRFDEMGPRLVRKLSFKTPPTVVVVDPFSSGMMLCSLLEKAGYAVIRVLSKDFGPEIENLVPKNIKKVNFVESLRFNSFFKGTEEENNSANDTYQAAVEKLVVAIMRIGGVHIENFMVGCESGVSEPRAKRAASEAS